MSPNQSRKLQYLKTPYPISHPLNYNKQIICQSFRADEGTDNRGVDKAITDRGCLEIRL